MSNFLSPPDVKENNPRYPENLFLDTTREALEESGLKVIPCADTSDDSVVLFVYQDEQSPQYGRNIPFNAIIVRVDPNGRLYVTTEVGLRILQGKLTHLFTRIVKRNDDRLVTSRL